MPAAVESSVGVMDASLHTANHIASPDVCGLRHDFLWHGLHNCTVASEERNHLRAWREKREMTQEELAEKVGTTKAVISLLENEKRPLSSKWLRKLAEALETQPGYILDYDPNDLSSDIFDIWDNIDQRDRAQAARVLSTFRRTGTKG